MVGMKKPRRKSGVFVTYDVLKLAMRLVKPDFKASFG
jgi:hypothetical protein